MLILSLIKDWHFPTIISRFDNIVIVLNMTRCRPGWYIWLRFDSSFTPLSYTVKDAFYQSILSRNPYKDYIAKFDKLIITFG